MKAWFSAGVPTVTRRQGKTPELRRVIEIQPRLTASKRLGAPVAVLQDLSGPKVRLGEVRELTSS